MAEIICDDKATREINREVRELIASGESRIDIRNPGARHNLGVALVDPVHVVIDGSVGYYCAGMMDGATIEINGSAGWGLAESMMAGKVIVHGNTGNGTAASIRGGVAVVEGHASARLGVAMKGGLVVVGGDCGYMAGFMGQKGTMIICGDTGEAFADSMYELVCFVGGEVGDLGNDAVIEEPSGEEFLYLKTALSEHLGEDRDVSGFKKVAAGRKLWNFDKNERAAWREAL